MVGIRAGIARELASALDALVPGRMPWNTSAARMLPVGDGARPVVIQGGIATDPSMYEPMRRFLRNVGFADVTVARSPAQTLGSVRDDARALARAVHDASARSVAGGGDGMVSVLAHSKGGLIARDYIQNLDGIGSVSQLVTIGTPHRGFTLLAPRLSKFAARLLPNPAFRDLEASRGVARELNASLPAFMDDAAARNPGFRMVSLAGDTGLGNDMLVTVPSTIPPRVRGVEHHVFRDPAANHGSIAGCITGLHDHTARTAANLLAGHSLSASVENVLTGRALLRPVT